MSYCSFTSVEPMSLNHHLAAAAAQRLGNILPPSSPGIKTSSRLTLFSRAASTVPVTCTKGLSVQVFAPQPYIAALFLSPVLLICSVFHRVACFLFAVLSPFFLRRFVPARPFPCLCPWAPCFLNFSPERRECQTPPLCSRLLCRKAAAHFGRRPCRCSRVRKTLFQLDLGAGFFQLLLSSLRRRP